MGRVLLRFFCLFELNKKKSAVYYWTFVRTFKYTFEYQKINKIDNGNLGEGA